MTELAMPEQGDDFARQVLDACVRHGREMLEFQRPDVEAGNYDLMPELRTMVTDCYLAGVMWRYGEQFDLPTTARDRGFLSLMAMLVTDGVSARTAKRRMQDAYANSRDKDGKDTLALAVAYEAGDKQGALAKIFDVYAKNPEAAGAPWRMFKLLKRIAGVVAVAGFLIALLVGGGWGVAIGVALIAGIAVLAIASLVKHQMTKP